MNPAILAEAAAVRAGIGFRAPIPVSTAGPDVLAFGAWFKNAPCLVHDGRAWLTEPLGDLDDPDVCRLAESAAQALRQRDGVAIDIVAHDLHPDFHSTRLACAMAAELGVPAVAVQHHHAHVAAVLAEHGHAGPALGLALDGVGLGTDGTAWGGELLRVDGDRFVRLGHLRPLPLPGGDRAAREPWRMAAAGLHALGREERIATRFAHRREAATLVQVLARPSLCPMTTSLGRWFDAVSGLLGVCEVMRFEAEAAMALERLATAHGPVEPDRDGWTIGTDGVLDLLPVFECLTAERDPARGAARFHATLVAAMREWVRRAHVREAVDTVVLSGGCFHNRLLSDGLARGLRADGLCVLEARVLSPGDAGIALGQAWVALQSFHRRT